MNSDNEEINDDDEKELFKLKQQYDEKLNILIKKREMEKATSSKNIDKNGYKICQLLIDPIIAKFISDLENIQKTNNKHQQEISNILKSLDVEKLKDDMNKYITLKFKS